MDAISPVFACAEGIEVTYAKDQPEYIPLPVVRSDNCVVSRWRLTPEERAHIASGGDFFIMQKHFGERLQPICPLAEPELDVMARFIAEAGE